MSGYSALELLCDDLEEVRGRLLGLRADTMRRGIGALFSSDQASFFASIGARVLPARDVSVLYRIRSSCNDRGAPGWAVAFFAYLIAAWSEANSADDGVEPRSRQERRGRWPFGKEAKTRGTG